MSHNHNFSFRLFCCVLVCLTLYCNRSKPATHSFNLLEGSLEADFIWDTRHISLSGPESRAALLHGWRTSVPKDHNIVIAKSPRAIAIFHCFTMEDKQIQFRAKPVADLARNITVQVNNRPVGKQKLMPGARSYSFQAPAGVLRHGTNYLAFLSQGDLEVDSLSIVSTNANHSENAEQPVSATSTSITAGAPSAVRFYVRLPQDTSLSVRYGILKNESPTGASARFVIAAEADGGKHVEIYSDTLSNHWYTSGEKSKTLSLAGLANRPLRLTLQTEVIDGHPAARTYWSTVRVILPDAPPAVDKKPKPDLTYLKAGYTARTYPNVIIYLVDALRADHLQPYGYPLPITPSLVNFSHDSVVFENAYSHVSWTRPSITTIMTGLYPSTHLVQNRLDMLPDFLPTLPRQLRSHGYENLAFITQPNIGKEFGFSRDFSRYEQLFKLTKNGSGEFPTQSDFLVQSVINALKQSPFKQTFVYIHAVDTHGPLAPHKQFLPDDKDCNFSDPEINYAQKFQRVDENDHCRVAIYDAAVKQSDFYFGQFIDFLKQKGVYEDSLILFTADHGESLIEHGKWGHGENLYQADIHVPLFVKLPRQQLAGTRVAAVARHIDVMPTVLDYLGFKKPEAIQGESLLTQITAAEDRVVFSELNVDNIKKRCILLDHSKLIETPHPVFGAVYELYDTKTDPLEKHDLKGDRPVLLGYLRTVLHEWERLQAARALKLRKPGTAVLDKETEESLKALGYLQ